VGRKYASPTSTDEEIEIITCRIEDARLDLTCNYHDWLIVGFAISDEMGEAGRSYFHRLSRFHPEYKPSECDRQYDRCLKGKNRGVTIRSFYFLAQQAGINIKTTIKRY
jgi:hypothetical protein